MMKKRFLIPLSVLAIIIIVYLSLWVPTTPVVKTVKDVYCGKISVDADSTLHLYDMSKYFPEMVYADMRITRLLVIHNGRHGYMYVIYSREYMDAEKNIINASCNVPSKWEIEKIDGKWTIIDIEESP